MKLQRRSLILLSAFLLGSQCPAEAWAQSYPARPVRYIVPSSPGGGADFLGRIVADELTQALGQQFVVDNRAGAASNIGAEIAAQANPDGHTLFQCSVTLTINATLFRRLAYDLTRDFATVSLMVIQPSVLIVNAKLPVNTVQELITLAKTRPGQINYSSAGTGSASFFATELFKSLAGVDMLHVPYKGGGPALNAVVAGETSVQFAPYPPAKGHIEAGRVRVLGVSSSQRLAELPQYPTVAESGVTGFESNNWYGLMVPVKTPKTVVTKLHAAVAAIVNKPAVNQRLKSLGYIPVGNRPEEYARFVKSEIALHAKLIRQTGLEPR